MRQLLRRGRRRCSLIEIRSSTRVRYPSRHRHTSATTYLAGSVDQIKKGGHAALTTQDEFASLSLMSSGGECGAEATFVLAEATLDSLNANDKCLRSGQRGWWE